MSKSIFFILMLVISLTVSAIPVTATTLYVDVKGNDTNAGTAEKPFKTIQKAADVAHPGDTVKVRPGIYYERVQIKNSGLPDQPITFEGERGTDGSWLTIVDGSVSVGSWVPAPEIASGVYKTTSIPFEPYSMVVNEAGKVKDIPKLNNPPGSEHEGFIYLSKAADAKEVTYSLGVEVNFWDGLDALYYYVNGTTYVRFRNGDNPNIKPIRVSSGTSTGNCFLISNKAYITIRNFQIRAAWKGLNIANPGTHHVVIEDNNIIATGREKIIIQVGANNIDIRNNVMYMSGLSSKAPGSWSSVGDGSAPYVRGVNEHIYWAYKYYLSDRETSTQEDSGIAVYSAGANIKIYGNEIYDTLGGISVENTQDIEIYKNEIYNISSSGIFFGPGTVAKVHDNLIYNCNLNLRFGTFEDASNGRSAYIYNNKFYNPEGYGNHVFFHYRSKSSTPVAFSNTYFYHNAFAGGNVVLAISSYADDNGGLKKTKFLNNIFSSAEIYGNGGRVLYEDSAGIEIFDYNWLGGNYLYGNPPAWAGSNNIFAKTNFIWSNAAMPNFVLPEKSTAMNVGIDLSSSFQIDGKSYNALPGLKPQYFHNEKPDMGIIPAGSLLITPPQGLRIAGH